MARLSPYSRVRHIGTVEVNGKPQLDLLNFQWERFNKFIEDRPKAYYPIPEEEDGRLDLIAYKHYKNVQLWWVIALANEILNPIDEVSAGKMLKIPRPSDIEEFQQLLQRAQRRGQKVAIHSRSV